MARADAAPASASVPARLATFLAGLPAHSWPAGMVVLGSRTEPAASTDPLPTEAPSGTTHPQPIVHSSASVAPLTELPAPIVTRRPTESGELPVAVSSALSCTLLISPMVMVPASARTTAPYHTDAPGLSVTAPASVALGATKFWPIVGALPPTVTAVHGIGSFSSNASEPWTAAPAPSIALPMLRMRLPMLYHSADGPGGFESSANLR
mmetsp:Transcript_21748/g.55971  ORF Transcript_21748/g.55971 Transcript_21748/m.55971 type:complete len:209 (+) Transcript_21748:330-956(+)